MSSSDMGVVFTGGKSDSWELSSRSKPGGSPRGAGRENVDWAERWLLASRWGEGGQLCLVPHPHKGWTSGHVMAHALQQGEMPTQLDSQAWLECLWEPPAFACGLYS